MRPRRPLLLIFGLLLGLASQPGTASASSGLYRIRKAGAPARLSKAPRPKQSRLKSRPARVTAAPRSPSASPVRVETTIPAAPSRVEPRRSWNLQGELLGRGGLYSLNLEYAPASLFAAGAGISYQSVTTYPQLEGQNLPVPVRIDVLTLPFYANYYPLESTRHRPYVTGGMTLVSIQAQTDDVGVHASVGDQEANLLIRGMDLGSATLPLINLGGGYEYAHASGFLMRAQALIFYVGHVQPTLGLSVGYRF